MMEGDSQHPESATAETAGIWVPEKVADPEPDTEDAAAAFQAQIDKIDSTDEIIPDPVAPWRYNLGISQRFPQRSIQNRYHRQTEN
jgi:hypothetical protein